MPRILRVKGHLQSLLVVQALSGRVFQAQETAISSRYLAAKHIAVLVSPGSHTKASRNSTIWLQMQRPGSIWMQDEKVRTEGITGSPWRTAMIRRIWCCSILSLRARSSRQQSINSNSSLILQPHSIRVTKCWAQTAPPTICLTLRIPSSLCVQLDFPR